MKPKQKIWAIFIIISVLFLNLYFIILGKEDFPFTNAPMFAHYIGDSTLFYDFVFVAQKGKTEKIVYPSGKTARDSYDLPSIRLFFSKFYGSAERDSPFGYIEDDSKPKLEARVSQYFSAYFKFLQKDTARFDSIRFEIIQYDRKYNFKQKQIVGYYSLNSKLFTCLCKNNY